MPAFAALAQRPSSLVAEPSPARASRSARPFVVNALQHQQLPAQQQNGWAAGVARLCGVAASAAVLLAGGAADAREKVAEFPTSGLLFKDTVKIIELNDDKGEDAGSAAAGRKSVLTVSPAVAMFVSRVAAHSYCLQSTAQSFILPIISGASPSALQRYAPAPGVGCRTLEGAAPL